jgi:hypothetical protein
LHSEGTVAEASDETDGEEADGPGLAALGLAAALAIALAALRGTATVVQDWRQRRLEHDAETAPLREARLKHQLAGEEAMARHAAAMQGIDGKAAEKRAKNGVPSSHDYGRKALTGGGRSGGGSGRGAGPVGGSRSGSSTGPGRTSKSGSVSGGGSKAPGSGKGSSGTPSSSRTGSGGTSAGTKGSGSKSGSGSGTGSGKGIKSPTGGKSPGTSGSSPAIERAKGRQDRAAAREGAKLQRRADRQAARLEDRAKDKDARREARQKAREARVAERQKKKEEAAADPDRVTLGEATAKEARRRLNKRRKHLDPPVLSKTKRKKKAGKPKAPDPATTKVDLTKKPKVDLTKKPKAPGPVPTKVDLTKKPKVNLTKAPKAPDPATTKVDLTKKPKVSLTKKPRPPKAPQGTSGPGRKKGRAKKGKKAGAAAGTGPSARRKQRRKERTRRSGERAKAKAGKAEETTTGPGPGTGWTFYQPPPREERRSAYDSMHATDPQQAEVWTAEQVFPGGGYASAGHEALTTGARGLPAGTGSTSTTTVKETPVGTAHAPAVRTPMDAKMDAEHATEITLDDVVDFLTEVVEEAFGTHDECVILDFAAQFAAGVRAGRR